VNFIRLVSGNKRLKTYTDKAFVLLCPNKYISGGQKYLGVCTVVF